MLENRPNIPWLVGFNNLGSSLFCLKQASENLKSMIWPSSAWRSFAMLTLVVSECILDSQSNGMAENKTSRKTVKIMGMKPELAVVWSGKNKLVFLGMPKDHMTMGNQNPNPFIENIYWVEPQWQFKKQTYSSHFVAFRFLYLFTQTVSVWLWHRQLCVSDHCCRLEAS